MFTILPTGFMGGDVLFGALLERYRLGLLD
jgi:hypothetical protein